MGSASVFISSVVDGYEAEREAARSAVESLRLKPIMAERDFGAKPYSSREACIEGVRRSDIYLGIFGSRYGHIAPSGRSVTEEEFEEARTLGKPILCFVQRVRKEPEQQAFLDRIGRYEEGNFFEFFHNVDALRLAVVRALNDLVNQPGISTLDREAIGQHLDRYRWGGPSRPIPGTWLGAVFFPLRQGEDYVSPLSFDSQEYQDSVLQPARFGPTRLLDQELGVTATVRAGSIDFAQRAQNRQLTTEFDIHTDGTIVYQSALGQGRDSGLNDSFLRTLVIDERDVRERLTRFVEYARHFYEGLERGPLISALGGGVSLGGLEYKGFGLPPSTSRYSMTMPQRLPRDPVLVPPGGMKLARSRLSEPDVVALELTRYLGLAFKDVGAYYGDPG